MPNLSISAPTGAHFDYDEVKTKNGTQSLGEAPILVWDDVNAAVSHYGADKILSVLDGTSLRVSFQGIARRGRMGGKSDDDVAKQQIEFRPGNRVVGESTPQSRATRAAKAASEKVDGDKIAAFLKNVAEGKISEADLAAFV